MRDLVIQSLLNNLQRILPGVEPTTITRISLTKQGRLGLHITDSSRFLVTLHLNSTIASPSTVKIFVKHRPNVSDEYHNLRILWDTHYFSADRFLIPIPFAVDPINSLLFLEYLPGQHFMGGLYKNLLTRANGSTFAENRVRAAAAWLVDFQRICSSKSTRALPPELSDYQSIVESLNQLDHSSKHLLIRKVDRLLADFPRYNDTYVHDQYLFRNILYYKDKILVVDFPHLRRGWPLYDFFSFYTGLERLQQYPLISPFFCDLLKRIFLMEYTKLIHCHYDPFMIENLWMIFLIVCTQKRYKQFHGIRGFLNRRFLDRIILKLQRWSTAL